MKKERVVVVGLGYVGLPLAAAFAESELAPVTGYDISEHRVENLLRGHDACGEVPAAILQSLLFKGKLAFTTDPADLRAATCVIVTVPTPVTDAKMPDLSAVISAAEIVGRNLQEGAVVAFESTVYPGVTREVIVPAIERASGMRCGERWFIGYSPERVNPGDHEHGISRVVKVVAGMDQRTTDRLAFVYQSICRAGVHRAPSIEVAETAKVFENVQRDLGIAAVNELAIICGRLGISTADVLAAARTKWNFVDYRPGLVGGHCIGVDPYYLAYCAQRGGYHPEVILAGRRVNDAMAGYVADLILERLIAAGKLVKGSRVLILGLTFKPNVPDTRNSKVRDVIARLQRFHVEVLAHDPLLAGAVLDSEFGAVNAPELASVAPVDGIVIATLHDAFRSISTSAFRELLRPPGVIVDVSAHFAHAFDAMPDITYRCL